MSEYLTMTKIIQLKELDEYARANMLVLIVFQDKKDKAGDIYIRHLNKVSESFKENKDKVVALLHDLVEDTSFTFEDLEELEFSKDVISTLKLLTNDLESYEAYIDRLIESDNILAKKVKMADLLDNMNLNRFLKLEKSDFDRVKNKYCIAYERILSDLERRIIK